MSEYVPSSNRAYYYRAFKNCKNTTECMMRFMWCPTDRKHTQLQIHHIDGDITNNEPENLLCMCVECHAAIHGFYVISLNQTQLIYSKTSDHSMISK